MVLGHEQHKNCQGAGKLRVCQVIEVLGSQRQVVSRSTGSCHKLTQQRAASVALACPSGNSPQCHGLEARTCKEHSGFSFGASDLLITKRTKSVSGSRLPAKSSFMQLRSIWSSTRRYHHSFAGSLSFRHSLKAGNCRELLYMRLHICM